MASGSDFFANINNSVMQTSRAQDVRKDTEKLMKNDYDWEQYLVHVPVSVAVLGHLVCVSARKDFAINHGMEHRTFQYIKYPESFRACLMQVCNGAWEAFNSAHKSMDQIRRYSLQMPRNLSTVVETLMQDNDAIVSSLLPGQLQNIEDVTHECYQLASQVESQFMYVISVISELMEAFTCSTKLHNDSVREAEKEIKHAKIMRRSAEEAKRLSEQNYQAMEKQVKEAQEAYKEAMKALPSAWTIIGLGLVDSIKDTLTFVPNMFRKLVPNVTVDSHQGWNAQASASENEDSTVLILSKANQLKAASDALAVFVSPSGKIKKEEIYSKYDHEFKPVFSHSVFCRLHKEVNAEKPCPAKNAFLNVCSEGIKICEDLLSIIQAPDSGKEKSMPGRIERLCKKCEDMCISASQKSCRPPLNCKGPHMAKASEKAQGTQSILQTHLNTVTFKVEQTKAFLHYTDEKARARFEEMKRCNKELEAILLKMERCNLEKIDFEETLKLLAEGMQALAQVKQQWSNLVQFFQNISSLIKVSLSQEIHKFVMECRSLPQIKEYSHSAFLKDLIYQQASEAGNISNIVHSISDTYVTVSRLYLMDMVGGLGILMATKPSLQDYRTLQNGCRRAMEDINRLVSRNMLEFSGGIQQRIRTIDGNLEAVLPSSQDRVREIKKSYGEGPDVVMKKLSEKDRDQFC